MNDKYGEEEEEESFFGVKRQARNRQSPSSILGISTSETQIYPPLSLFQFSLSLLFSFLFFLFPLLPTHR